MDIFSDVCNTWEPDIGIIFVSDEELPTTVLNGGLCVTSFNIVILLCFLIQSYYPYCVSLTYVIYKYTICLLYQAY